MVAKVEMLAHRMLEATRVVEGEVDLLEMEENLTPADRWVVEAREEHLPPVLARRHSWPSYLLNHSVILYRMEPSSFLATPRK